MRKLLVLALLLSVPFAVSAEREVVEISGADLQTLIKDSEERVVVVNLWATWCKPCVEEFPELVAFAKEYQGKDVRLILVSADFEDQKAALNAFLDRFGVDFTTYLKVDNDMAFIESFKPVDWQGALPMTIVYDKDRNAVATFNRKITHKELVIAVENALD
jgi:thiol-disulfide isomerase/thioredoxin